MRIALAGYEFPKHGQMGWGHLFILELSRVLVTYVDETQTNQSLLDVFIMTRLSSSSPQNRLKALFSKPFTKRTRRTLPISLLPICQTSKIRRKTLATIHLGSLTP